LVIVYFTNQLEWALFEREEISCTEHAILRFDFALGNVEITRPIQEFSQRDSIMPKQTLKVEIPIKRVFPEDLKTYFIEHMLCQGGDEHFTLSFFEVWQPPTYGQSPEEIRNELTKVGSVDAKCVARLVVTPKLLRKMIQAMNENLERFDARTVSKEQQK
jgi:hypothetical protein